MTQVTFTAVSAYRIKMETILVNCIKEGRAQIAQDELASLMGSRVTSAFRRRISEIQKDGGVTRFTYQTERGGYKVAYQINAQFFSLQ